MTLPAATPSSAASPPRTRDLPPLARPGRPTYHAPGGLGVRVDCALYAGYARAALLRQPGRQADRARRQPQRGADAAAARARRISWSAASTPPCRCTSASSPTPTFINGDYDIHWLERFVGQKSDRRVTAAPRHVRPTLALRVGAGMTDLTPRSAAARLRDRRLSRWRETARRPGALLGRSGAARRAAAGRPSTCRAACASTVRREPFEIRIDTRLLRRRRRAAPSPAERRDDLDQRARSCASTATCTRCGFAHSVECWRDGRAGRRALRRGARRRLLRREHVQPRDATPARWRWSTSSRGCGCGGFALLDTQFLTAHLAQFGAVEIPRAAYRRQLARAIDVTGQFAARARRRRRSHPRRAADEPAGLSPFSIPGCATHTLLP